jgi:hypothetical protein
VDGELYLCSWPGHLAPWGNGSQCRTSVSREMLSHTGVEPGLWKRGPRSHLPVAWGFPLCCSLSLYKENGDRTHPIRVAVGMTESAQGKCPAPGRHC